MNPIAGPKRRNDYRRIVMWPAIVVTGYGRWNCTILDVSRGGAKLKLPGELPAKSYLTLTCEHFGSVEAVVMWRKDGLTGIRFRGSESVSSVEPFPNGGWAALNTRVRFGRRRA